MVHIVDTSNVTSAADSAMKTASFTFAQLVSGTTTDSTSITLAAGDVKGDNRRVVAVSFLQDAAGNLSSSGASDITPVGITDINMHVLDLTLPVITPANPKAGATDSTYFTGVVSTSLNIVPLAGGAAAATTFNANPLEFKTSEGVKTATAEFNDSTYSLTTAATNASTGLVAGNSFKVKFATDFGISTQGGKSENLTIAITDSVGNAGTNTQSGVTYDQVLPGAVANSLFPTRAAAPPDVANSNAPTINQATMMPVLRLLEASDSLAARYIEVTAGTAKSAKLNVASGDAQLAITDADIKLTFVDTLFSDKDYSLQVLFRDLAGNHNVTAPDTLTFDAAFQNPEADSFAVTATGGIDAVIAGQALVLDIAGIDTALTRAAGSNRAAVTYSSAASIRVSAGVQDTSTVTISGTGVTDNGDGTAALNAAGWSLGTRSVTIKSTKALTYFTAVVENKTGDDVNFSGEIDSLVVDAAELSSYNVAVVADADGGDTATSVSGGFKVSVAGADQYGNPSTKTYAAATTTPSRTDSTNLTNAKMDSSLWLGEIFVTFASNNGDVSVPQGPQAVSQAGSVFTVGGASTSGTDLVISVRTLSADGDTVGNTAAAGLHHDRATGSTAALTFAPEGVTPVDPTALGAPANLLVQDWLGASGTGDQGGFVSVAFPSVSGADRYRIFREMQVTSGLDADGKVDTVAAVAAWVSWTVVDNIAGDTVQRAVVPTLDNAATKWAVASEAGGTSSERTSSKRVFTKQIVQNMVQYFGVDPNRVLSMTELVQAYTPAEDYVKSIIGDRKDITFAAIDPDLTTMLGGAKTVPQNIRTQSAGVTRSARTATETAVKATDNIPPAAVTGLGAASAEGGAALTWTASADDKIVAYSTYKGYAVPIAGVDRYDVYRGATEDALELVGSVSGGVTTFTDSDLGSLTSVIYRVDAADLDNAPVGPVASLALGFSVYRDAAGARVYIIDENDGTPLVQDFGDFIAFAGSFNKSEGDDGFQPSADTDESGLVDFADFIAFAGTFNSTATTVNGNPIPNTKRVVPTLRPGVNDNVQLSLNLSSDKVLVGQTVTLNVKVDNATSLQGFGFDLSYDTDKFEYVNATPAQDDLLKSGGAETPVFLKYQETPGEIAIANAIVDGSPSVGTGNLVSLTFRVLTEFEDNARFEIASGIVFDGSKLSNPVVALGSLNVESTPTEFALLQNFPNPFNPETTIKYNVAEGGNVALRIYNVVGQVVRTLVAEQQSAGRYTVRWNGNDDRGVSVSSGIYFYQITAGSEFQDVKKLMLLK
jgi:hypothetical protein